MRVGARLWVVVEAAVLAGILSGCPGRSDTESGATAAGLSAEVVETPFVPIVVPFTPEMAAAAEAARIQSDALDAHCAFLEMNPNVASRRPEGLGCPRPNAPFDSWGAN